jgi:hypothetical protein
MGMANMRSLSVRSLSVSCTLCHHAARLDVDGYADDATVPSFGPRMVCTACGIIGADARPNWREQTERPPKPPQTRDVRSTPKG